MKSFLEVLIVVPCLVAGAVLASVLGQHELGIMLGSSAVGYVAGARPKPSKGESP